MTLPFSTVAPPDYSSEIISEERLLRRICVSKPYYALLKPTLAGHAFYASAAADLPLGAEVGPMSSAEISRHAAISGLCAAALAQTDDNRRFYLAQRAEYWGVPNGAPYGVPVTFAATLQSFDKRGARSEIVVQAADEPLATLVVDYTILTEYAFSRLFRARYRSTTPQPAMNIDLPGRAERLGERAAFDVTALPETVCAGHFADYPALPVALLMGQLGTAAWRLMNASALAEGEPNGVRWRGVRASVNATDLCWAGERVRFEAERTALHPERQSTFNCQVSAGDRLVCTAEFRLEAH